MLLAMTSAKRCA